MTQKNTKKRTFEKYKHRNFAVAFSVFIFDRNQYFSLNNSKYGDSKVCCKRKEKKNSIKKLINIRRLKYKNLQKMNKQKNTNTKNYNNKTFSTKTSINALYTGNAIYKCV